MTRRYPDGILPGMVIHDSAAEFGAEIRRIRRLQGLSQPALAALAGVDKETITRAEAGSDIRVTTVSKLRRVLPELGNAALTPGGTETMDETTTMATKIGHLLLGFTSQERLFRIKAFILSQLQEEHGETRSPAFLEEQRHRQDVAESNLIARRPVKLRNGRKSKRANGGGHS